MDALNPCSVIAACVRRCSVGGGQELPARLEAHPKGRSAAATPHPPHASQAATAPGAARLNIGTFLLTMDELTIDNLRIDDLRLTDLQLMDLRFKN